jgi:Transglutaminase-like superfamily
VTAFRNLLTRAHTRALVIEAAAWLGLVGVCRILFPFRWISKCFGRRMSETLRADLSPPQVVTVHAVRRCVRVAASRVPWKPLCLSQAIAAKLMLTRRGIASTLYFGVRKTADPAREFQAHAWVRAGVVDVTPSGERRDFAVIAMFG